MSFLSASGKQASRIKKNGEIGGKRKFAHPVEPRLCTDQEEQLSSLRCAISSTLEIHHLSSIITSGLGFRRKMIHLQGNGSAEWDKA